jgi:hypothetical protein
MLKLVPVHIRLVFLPAVVVYPFILECLEDVQIEAKRPSHTRIRRFVWESCVLNQIKHSRHLLGKVDLKPLDSRAWLWAGLTCCK